MASYRGHLAFSCSIGFVYGGVGHSTLGLDPATSLLGAGVTAVGGLIPDLDSDSGVPVRELFSLAAAVVPLLLVKRLSDTSLTAEEILIALAMIYGVIRFGLSRLLKRLTVHRGMFHSVPAMVIAGGCVFLAYEHSSLTVRAFMGVGMMVGFLSHLALDELYSVDFRGLRIKLNQFAGSALKFASKSWIATATTYALLGVVLFGVANDPEVNAALHEPPPAEQVVLAQPWLTPMPQPSRFDIVLGEPVMQGARNMSAGVPIPRADHP